MVKTLRKWIRETFSDPVSPSEPQNKFCYWCHSKECPYIDYLDCKANKLVQAQRCPYHNEVMPPPYCHRCCYPSTKPSEYVKPTLYKPDPNRYDRRLCLDWICEACDKRDKEREDLWNRQNQDTAEAAELSFTKENNEFFYYGQPLKADFSITYESLAPFVKRIHRIASPSLSGGIEWEYISIREGCVYIHDELREYKEWSEDV